MPDSADLPCLSLHAPWLWAIMHAGKDIENRGLSFPRRFRGQPVVGDVWLHASKWPGPSPVSWWPDLPLGQMESWRTECHRVQAIGQFYPWGGVTDAMFAMRGHIVGRVEVVRFVDPGEHVDSVWRERGSTAIEVRNPRSLATPVPAKGALGWWSPDEATKAALRGQLATEPARTT